MPTDIDPIKLREHVDAGYRRLAGLRAMYRESQQEYAGRFAFRDDGKRRHINLVNRTGSTFIRHIASSAPTHEVETDDAMLHGEASLLSLFLDRQAQTSKRWLASRLMLQDAFMGPRGIMMVGLKGGSGLVKAADTIFDRGSITTQPIPFCDYVCDPSSDLDHTREWEGYFYSVNRDTAIESGLFHPSIEDIKRIGDANLGSWGDSRDTDKLGQLDPDERFGLFDKIPLLDVFFYDDDVTWVITLSGEVEGQPEFLRVEKYEGHGRSPLVHLQFDPLMGYPHGVPPASQWRESAESFYVVVNKMISQAERLKNNLLYRRDVSEDEIDAVRDSADGDALEVSDPSAINSITIGHVSPDLVPMAGWLQAASNTSGSQTDIAAGGSGRGKTATQYSGDLAAVSKILEDYQNTHDDAESEITAKVAFYGQHDPTFAKPVTVRLPGTEPLQIGYPPGVRRGDFEAFRFRIIPRSMQQQDPNVQSMRVMQFLDMTLKTVQVSMATGGMIDAPGIIGWLAPKFDARGLEKFIRNPVMQIQAMQAQAAMPPNVKGQPSGVMPDRLTSPQGAMQGARTAIGGAV